MLENKTNSNSIKDTEVAEPLNENYSDLFKTIFDDSESGICIVDFNGNLVELNNNYAELFGYSKSELIGKHYSVLLTDDSKPVVDKNHKSVFNGTSVLKAEEKVKHKNGTFFYIQTTNFRVNDEQGNKLRITTAVDISSRLRNELVQSVLLRISNLVNESTLNKEFYSSIYKYICQLMPVKNFAICLGNSKANNVEIPFMLSEFNYERKEYLIEEHNYIERNNKSILLDEYNIEYLVENDELLKYAEFPKAILGVPLKIKEEMIGSILIRSFNGTRYTNEHKEILELVAAQVSRVIERKRYEDKLLKARNVAEESVRLKSEFLAQVSHEIRTPLNSILSFSSLIRNELAGTLSEELEETFEYIERGGNRLTRTIDLILNVSKMQNQQYKIELHEVDLVDEVLRPVIKELKTKACEKGIKLDLDCDNKSFRLVCDQYSLNQLFVNLVENAIKYTNEGSITVKIFKNDIGNVQVDIVDTGIGISEEYIPKLFEPFSQEEQGYTRTHEGIGLGLSLVKSYAELNNAEIKVKSEKNIGSTFSVIFNS